MSCFQLQLIISRTKWTERAQRNTINRPTINNQHFKIMFAYTESGENSSCLFMTGVKPGSYLVVLQKTTPVAVIIPYLGVFPNLP